jgi:Zn-dependent protease
VSLDAQTVVWFACLVAAVVLHEVSHGVVALAFGDDTAARAGRLTLNPLPHLDPFGSVIVPALGAITGLPVIGWAKPVPVSPARLRHPRRDMLWVSLAGPFTNFVLSAGAAVGARLAYAASGDPFRPFAEQPLGFRVLLSFAFVNLALGLFNLLPIPPLDGSSLLERALPARWLPAWWRFRPYGILVLFLLVFGTGLLGRVIDPFADALTRFVYRL